MKKIILSCLVLGSIGCAQPTIEEVNQQLLTVSKSIDVTLNSLKEEVSSYKKSLQQKITKDMEDEQGDYDALVNNFNFFKLKHEHNYYAQDKIKKDEEKLKEVTKNHQDFQQRLAIKIQQLSHDSFVPEEKKETQEKIFFFEVKKEEFSEMLRVNKERYESQMILLQERYTNDAQALIKEFDGIQYKKTK